MIVSRRKALQKGKGARSKVSAGKAVKQTTAERLKNQHKNSVLNAGNFVRFVKETATKTKVDRSLFEIFKIVRDWPSKISETGSHVFELQFKATEIIAEESLQDNDAVISVTFSYLGNTYDFVCRIENSPSADYAPGTITLHENGERVISLEIVQDIGNDEFFTRDFRSVNIGAWIENITSIEKEIESYRDKHKDGPAE